MEQERSVRMATVVGLLLAVVLLLLRIASEGLLEMGDGVTHYMIARYSWKHPMLFLDLWGKPLFTLLASPFAQLGHAGVAVFNACVAAATAWAGVRALRGAGAGAQLAFPFLVLLAPQYVLMVMAGMTEPFFGLLTVIAVLLLVERRSVAGAIVASLTPFARPEYIVFLPAVMGWLVLRREWRALPWCGLGLAVHAVLMTVVSGEPLWFWTGDPYRNADGAYGSGPLDFFVARAEMIFGRPLLTLGIAALVLWPVVWWRDRAERSTHLLMLVTAALPVLGIVAIHSILWYTGLRGSAGLLRVVTTAIPLAGLFTAMTLGRGGLLITPRARPMHAMALSAAFLIALWSVKDLMEQQRLPIEPEMNQHFLDTAAGAVKHYRSSGERVFSTHPYMAFRAGLDPYDTAVYNPIWGWDQASVDRWFHPGDLFVWDAQLGNNEAGIKLDQVLNDHRFTVLEAFEPPNGSRVLGGHVYEIFLFERRDAERTFTIDTIAWNGAMRDGVGHRADLVPCAQPAPGRWCLKEGEFPFELAPLPLPSAGTLYDEWMVSAKATVEDGSRLVIVFTQARNGRIVRYDEEEVHTGDLWFNRRVPPVVPGTEQKIYLWNMGRKPVTLDDITVLRKRWAQHTL